MVRVRVRVRVNASDLGRPSHESDLWEAITYFTR